MTKINVNARLLSALREIAPNSGLRYYIEGVRLEPFPVNGNYGVRMIATDGHIMAIALDPWGYVDAPVTLEFNPKEKAMKKPARESGHRNLVWNGEGAASIVANQPDNAPCGEGAEAGFMSCKVQSAEYPTWQRVLPHLEREHDPSINYAWDAVLISRVGKCISAVTGSKAQMLDFYQTGPAEPALVRSTDYNLVFVVMPMRRNGFDNNGMPEWAFEELPKAEDAA